MTPADSTQEPPWLVTRYEAKRLLRGVQPEAYGVGPLGTVNGSRAVRFHKGAIRTAIDKLAGLTSETQVNGLQAGLTMLTDDPRAATGADPLADWFGDGAARA